MDSTVDNTPIDASQSETVSGCSGESVPKEIWPNFFIVGAPRAGTTSLYEYLRQIPGIYMPSVKEPRYFNSFDYFAPFAPAPILNKAKYLRLFKGVKDEVAVGEASPSYLMDPEAPKRIHQVVPDARVIMILRDPVEQIYSTYLLHRRAGFHRLTFQEAAKLDRYQRPAFYAESAQRYLETFGADRIKILIFEEFIHDTTGALREVLKFLGVNAEPPPSVGEAYNAFALPRLWTTLITQNRVFRRIARALVSDRLRRSVREIFLSRKSPKPPIPEEPRKFLEDLYRDDVLRLEKIIGRPLPWFHAKVAAA